MGLNVAIVRDDRYLMHKTGHTHPDQPRRLTAVYQMLDRDLAGKVTNIYPDPAPLELIELVHTPIYIQKVMKTADHGFTSLAPDTPMSSDSYLAAWLAVGGCLEGLEALMNGRCDVCFALVRPPGHHALPDRGGGFCIFNNLGVTARHAIKACGVERILIVDWDIHHGNGLQDLFYSENRVLYFSSHDILLYPYTGNWEETGEGEGKGYTINLPLPREINDSEFFHLYHETLGPVIREYRPELILVAAGFDGHRDDPIGRSSLGSQAFRRITHLLLETREAVGFPPILLGLEGGYNPLRLARCVRAVIETLLAKESPNSLPEDAPSQRVAQLVEKAYKVHSEYGVWTG